MKTKTKLIKPVVDPSFEVNKDMAMMILDEYYYPRQRDARISDVSGLAEQMKAGLWRDCASMIQLATVGKKKYLIDGQHRLMAVAMAETPVRFVLVEHKCATQEEVGELYAVIDTGTARSLVDRFEAIRGQSIEGLSKRARSTFPSALAIIQNGFKPANKKLAAHTLAQMAPHYEEAFKRLMEALEPGAQRMVLLREVFAVLLEILKVKPGQGQEFVSQLNNFLAHPDRYTNAPTDDPVLFLANRLRDRGGKALHRLLPDNTSWTLIHSTILSWNHWRKNKSLNVEALDFATLAGDLDLS